MPCLTSIPALQTHNLSIAYWDCSRTGVLRYVEQAAKPCKKGHGI